MALACVLGQKPLLQILRAVTRAASCRGLPRIYIYIGLSRWLSRVDDHSTVDDKPQKYVYSTAALHSTFTLTHQTNLCKSL